MMKMMLWQCERTRGRSERKKAWDEGMRTTVSNIDEYNNHATEQENNYLHHKISVRR